MLILLLRSSKYTQVPHLGMSGFFLKCRNRKIDFIIDYHPDIAPFDLVLVL